MTLQQAKTSNGMTFDPQRTQTSDGMTFDSTQKMCQNDLSRASACGRVSALKVDRLIPAFEIIRIVQQNVIVMRIILVPFLPQDNLDNRDDIRTAVLNTFSFEWETLRDFRGE